MINTYKFYKTTENYWYIELPEWRGDIEDLQMVSGADTMLDIVAEGRNYVFLTLTDEFIDKFDVLELQVKCSDYDFDSQGGPSSGAYYLMKSYKGIEFNLKMWLCDVTRYVLGYFPENIYILKYEY